MKNFVILALGSNLGNRRHNFIKAIKEIKKIAEIISCANSYRSAAVVPKNSPKSWNKYFHNSVVSCYTKLNPYELLKATESIEKLINRNSRIKGSSGPRILDIDILAFNEEIIDTENLKIPHERMCERNFVIYPLAEILPEWKYYGKGKFKGVMVNKIKSKLPKIKKIKFNALKMH